ncbi:MAG: hypothetical protein IJT94_00130 [Oscillibacter sp.]|nr:hypothetical protein [Oscillibacter sp.]
MLGQLPRALDVNGTLRAIRAGYVNVLAIISAYNDPGLEDREKVYICLRRLYPDLDAIPRTDLPAAYEAAVRFIERGEKPEKPGPRLVDWEKDEHLIFPAVNAAAGREIRETPDLHWWTFLGLFQSISTESLFGTVLTIRGKLAKHRKLEKHEQAFYNANRALCELKTPAQRKRDTYAYLEALHRELLREGGNAP